MASGSDKVEEGMDPMVAETRVTFDTRLFRQNIVVLAFDIPCNFTKTTIRNRQPNGWTIFVVRETDVNSLSILSPNPGVSTIVKEIRTPSSSSSTKRAVSERETVRKWTTTTTDRH